MNHNSTKIKVGAALRLKATTVVAEVEHYKGIKDYIDWATTSMTYRKLNPSQMDSLVHNQAHLNRNEMEELNKWLESVDKKRIQALEAVVDHGGWIPKGGSQVPPGVYTAFKKLYEALY